MVFLCVCVYHIFIQSLLDGHLGGFHTWATENNSAMNTQGHVYFLISVFFKNIYKGVELLGIFRN